MKSHTKNHGTWAQISVKMQKPIPNDHKATKKNPN